MISNFSKNNMGTLSFDGKFKGMRKAQDFIVYPMKELEKHITIQSDTRIGTVCLETGKVFMSKPRSSGAYFIHLMGAEKIDTLDAATLLLLKAQLMSTASGKAGTNGLVFCNNSGALEVMG